MTRIAGALFVLGLLLVGLSGWGFFEEIKYHAWESKVLFAMHSLGLAMTCISPSLYLYSLFRRQQRLPAERDAADRDGGGPSAGE